MHLLQRPSPRSRAGMTFLELLVVMMVLAVAVTMFASMVMHTSRQRALNRENAIASNAARTAVELMRNQDFRELFALYNADPDDDPGGAGTAPGGAFDVPGLTPLQDDPDGLVGEIILPIVVESVETDRASWGTTTLDTTEVIEAVNGIVGGLLGGLLGGGEASGEAGGGGEAGVFYTLREDVVDKRLGLPRDLNGDSLIDDLDHAHDYIVLPVHVRLQWRGKFGPCTYDLYTQIALFAKVEG